MSEGEVWRDVVGYEGLYKVSDRGNIYSVERISLQGIKIGGVTLKPAYNTGGYLKVVLYKNGVRKTKSIHRIVAEAFIPNPESLPQINHKDEIKDNNNVENLEWCTSKYNNNHGTRLKRSARTKSKKIRAINVETGEVLTFNSGVEAMEKGYFRGNVSSACRGIYKNASGELVGDGRTYKGYRWYYEEGE